MADEVPPPAAVRIVELEDADFEWLLSAQARPRNGLSLAPGGVESALTLQHIRRLTKRLHESGRRTAWMAVAGREVVGMIGHKAAPSPQGVVEIGYGIAASRRGRGYATRAVAAVVAAARREPSLKAIVAETVADNFASQRVLEKNGFARAGEREDPEDGLLIVWRLELER
jgi:RimJ/RimL family protein N-acetyltransferase